MFWLRLVIQSVLYKKLCSTSDRSRPFTDNSLWVICFLERRRYTEDHLSSKFPTHSGRYPAEFHRITHPNLFSAIFSELKHNRSFAPQHLKIYAEVLKVSQPTDSNDPSTKRGGCKVQEVTPTRDVPPKT